MAIDVTRNDEHITRQTVLALLARAVFGAPLKLPRSIDWLAVFRECRAQAVDLLVLKALPDSCPEEVRKLWTRYASLVMASNMQVAWSHTHVHKLMTAAGIPYVILKGCASAAYYPKPELRSLGDVDFLVRPEDLDTAGDILKAENFTPWDEEHICHIVYKNGREHLEMHFEPSGMPNGEAGALMRSYLKDIFEKRELLNDVNGTMYVPSAFHHGLIILMHNIHHMTGEGIGLRHLLDWVTFANSFTDEAFRSLFEKRLKKLGLWKFAQVQMQLAEEYLSVPHKVWVGKTDRKLIDSLLEDIFAGGNFGSKAPERQNEAYIISTRGKEGVGKKGVLSQFVTSMNNVVKTHWKASEKNPLLLIPGWFYFGGRHAIRIMKGERKKVHLHKMVSEAKSRRNIYSQMKLYEEEKDN